MQKNVIISWSSGKDSTLTLERLMDNEQYNVVGLYTTYVKDEVPFQATPLYVLDMQAELLDLPLIKIELPESFPPNEIYQDTIIRGLKQSNHSIDAVAFGDMFCNGIEAYRRSYIEPAGWECVFPLLGQSSRDLADEIIAREIQTMVVTTDSSRLASQYCGKWYSEAFIGSLPDGVDPCGENGEFHTLVTDTRSYSGRIDIETTYIEEGGAFLLSALHREEIAKYLAQSIIAKSKCSELIK